MEPLQLQMPKMPPSYADFKNLETDMQRKIISYMVFQADTDTRKLVAREWGIAPGLFHTLAPKHGIQLPPKADKPAKPPKQPQQPQGEEPRQKRQYTKRTPPADVHTAAEVNAINVELMQRIKVLEDRQNRMIDLMETFLARTIAAPAMELTVQHQPQPQTGFTATQIADLKKAGLI